MAHMILGIDPGFGGALAWYDPSRRELNTLHSMPITTTGGVMLGKGQKEIDYKTLAKIIRAVPPTIVVMEHVASSPQMGVVSSFRFGQGFGGIQGVLASLGHTVRLVKPAVWKSGLQLTHDKKLSVDLAIKLFPSWRKNFEHGANSADLAEAALLAYYGERFLAKKEGPWEQ